MRVAKPEEPELRVDIVDDDLVIFEGASFFSVRACCRRLLGRGSPPELPLLVFRDNSLVTRVDRRGLEVGAFQGPRPGWPSR